MSESAELQRAMENLTKIIGQLRDDLVRKDVYAVDQRMTHARIENVDDDVKELKASVARTEERRAADRRLLLTSFALPIVLIIIQLYLASQTGGTP